MVCHGSVVFTRGMTDEGSDYANEGTCAHFLAAYCLDNGLDPRAFVKQVIVMLRDRRTKETHEVFEEERLKDSNFEAVYKISPSEDFCDHVQSYVDYVRELVSSTGGTLHVEQRLSLDFFNGGGRRGWHFRRGHYYARRVDYHRPKVRARGTEART